VAELKFSTESIRAEVNGMADLASRFLYGIHAQRLREVGYGLTRALDGSGIWEIPQGNPLETREVQRGSEWLVGRLSFKWEIKKLTPKTFRIAGIASTTLEIDNVENDSLPVSWNTDIGGAGHPGYRFHFQFRSNEKSVEVPRLPSILLTPVDCLDFLLGELFQADWTRHQLDKQNETAGWTQDVRTRMGRLLRAKATCAEEALGVTPWMALKVWNLKDPKLELCDE
jgi:hypothetical protein